MTTDAFVITGERAGCTIDPWTITGDAIRVDFLRPTPDMFELEDMAHHMGNLCRFTGGTRPFYSVAQHGLFVGQLVKDALDSECVDRESREYWDQILAGLLHDAAEFIVNDISSPLKVAIAGRYKEIEHSILFAIFTKFGVDFDYMNKTVKAADNIALQVERFYLMPDHPDWPKVPASEMIYPRPQFMDPITAAKEWEAAVRFALRCRGIMAPAP